MRARQWSSTSPRDRKASRPRTSSAYKTSAPRAEAWVTLASPAITASDFGQDHKPSRMGGFFIGAPGRAHSLGGESPLHTRQGEVLAERQGCPSRGGI